MNQSKFECGCGSKITNKPSNINAHYRTKKHMNYLSLSHDPATTKTIIDYEPDATYLPKEIQNIIIEYCNDYASEWWSLSIDLKLCYASVNAVVIQERTIKFLDVLRGWDYNLDRIAVKLNDLYNVTDTPCDMFDHIDIGVNDDEREYYDTIEEQIKYINIYIIDLFKAIDNIPNWHNMNTRVKYLPSDIKKFRKRLVKVHALANLDSAGLKQLKYIRQRPCYWKGR